MRRPLALLVLACLLPAVAAQVPTPLDPAADLSFSADPSGGLVVKLGSMVMVNITVELSYSNLVCNQDVTVDVSVAVKDSGLPGVRGTAPASIPVLIPAPQGGVALGTGRGTGTGSFHIEVAKSALPDHDHSFTLTATTPSSVPSGCQSVSPNAPTAVSKDAKVDIKTGPADTKTSGTGTQSGTGSSTSSASKGAPGFAVVPLLGALLVVAARRRR